MSDVQRGMTSRRGKHTTQPCQESCCRRSRQPPQFALRLRSCSRTSHRRPSAVDGRPGAAHCVTDLRKYEYMTHSNQTTGHEWVHMLCASNRDTSVLIPLRSAQVHWRRTCLIARTCRCPLGLIVRRHDAAATAICLPVAASQLSHHLPHRPTGSIATSTAAAKCMNA